nr:hypothetical protein B0A51_07604 [Rachicladosporium sp. CCFEE 5018]
MTSPDLIYNDLPDSDPQDANCSRGPDLELTPRRIQWLPPGLGFNTQVAVPADMVLTLRVPASQRTDMEPVSEVQQLPQLAEGTDDTQPDDSHSSHRFPASALADTSADELLAPAPSKVRQKRSSDTPGEARKPKQDKRTPKQQRDDASKLFPQPFPAVCTTLYQMVISAHDTIVDVNADIRDGGAGLDPDLELTCVARFEAIIEAKDCLAIIRHDVIMGRNLHSLVGNPKEFAAKKVSNK